MKKSFFLLFSITSFLFVQAQECKYYHREACAQKHEYEMNYDGQSRSAILGKGLKSEFHMVAYDGMDYRLTVCAEENLGGEIHLKLFEKRRVLIKDDGGNQRASATNDDYEDPYSSYSEESAQTYKKPKFKLVKELVYDNTEDGYSNMVEFTPDGSMSMIVEVSIPGVETESQLSLRAMGCVGVLVERSRSRRIGF